MEEPLFIGLAGKKRCGKSALSSLLSEEHGLCRISFATPIKREIICPSFHWDEMTLEKYKITGEVVDELVSTHNARLTELICLALNEDVSGEVFKKITSVKGLTVRFLLQKIGTDIIREHDSEWFVKRALLLAKSALSKGVGVVIDDVRFPNEIESIEAGGGEVFYIDRASNEDTCQHISENSVSAAMFDERHVLDNNGTLVELKNLLYKRLDDEEKAKKNGWRL